MIVSKSTPLPSSSFASYSLCSLQGSLLTLAILTLVSFTYLSLKSFHSSLSLPPQTNSSISFLLNLQDSEVDADVIHFPNIFHLNYMEMEKNFKIYVYPDGDPNTFYQTPRKLTGKYASEGYFFQNIRESRFLTHDPEQAHLFFIPISCHKMRGKVNYHFIFFYFILF